MILQEFRCKTDAKLLLKAVLVNGDIEVKCRACGTINRFLASGAVEAKYLCYKECPHRVHAPVTQTVG